jgi:hypothetical protein
MKADGGDFAPLAAPWEHAMINPNTRRASYATPFVTDFALQSYPGYAAGQLAWV